MMIHVNLHPKRGKKSSGGDGAASSLAALAAFGARVRATVTDVYLAGAVVAVVGACAAVGFLYTSQEKAEAEVVEREDAAVRDSAKYASLIVAQTKATARRDSLAAQLRVIAAIDSNRYVWAHLLDEMSRSLPQYTWLTSVEQTSAPPRPPAVDSASAPKGKGGKAQPAADSADAPQVTRFRLVGQTVDIQALTMFMRDLEGSPFVRNVQLASSQAVISDGKDVTEFTLNGEYQTPPRAALHTDSITVRVR
jgi:Tfp pilus assembly protein PilN